MGRKRGIEVLRPLDFFKRPPACTREREASRGREGRVWDSERASKVSAIMRVSMTRAFATVCWDVYSVQFSRTPLQFCGGGPDLRGCLVSSSSPLPGGEENALHCPDHLSRSIPLQVRYPGCERAVRAAVLCPRRKYITAVVPRGQSTEWPLPCAVPHQPLRNQLS